MKATVWSTATCPYCVEAKNLLTLKGVDFEERVVGEGWTKEQLREVVPDAQSVPQIFLDEDYVGGFNELRQRLGL